MDNRGRALLACIAAGSLTFAASRALGVSCPSGGVNIEVCIKNPTSTSQTATIVGNLIQNEGTCGSVGPQDSYFQGVTVNLINGATQCVPVTNLRSGMWLHEMRESFGGVAFTQYRKVPVLAGGAPTPTPTPADHPATRVTWTYYPNNIYVNQDGDGSPDKTRCPKNNISSPATCRLRDAIAEANDVSSPSTPTRILFGVSPGAMTLSTPLSLTAGNITIDAIEGDGNPWIVGDPSAPQDTFYCTVDLNNTTRFEFASNNNTIQGLYIANTIPSPTPGAGPTPTPAQQTKNLITADSGKKNNVVYAVKIDGGNRRDCPPQGCSGARSLFEVLGGTSFSQPAVTIRNVEGLAAIDKGVKANTGWGLVVDSWFHHNYRGNIQATLSGNILAERNFVDRAGRRVTDDLIVDGGANGLVSNGCPICGSSQLVTDGNISLLNRVTGISVLRSSSPILTAANDYTCGNGFEGVGVSGDSAVVTGQGIGAFYNADRGVKISTTGTGWSANFGDSSGSVNPGNNAFAQNGGRSDACQFANTNTSKAVNASRNYWYQDTPATCGEGAGVSTSPIRQFLSEDVTIDGDTPTIPSNVILAEQTFRIFGGGFDAIRGNPAPSGGCTTGDEDPPNSSCCLTQPQQANVCDTSNGPHHPYADKGNCVELCNGAGTWMPVTVSAVTPTMIAAQIPGNPGDMFACSGEISLVHVSKLDTSDPMNPPIVRDDEKPYCTNKSPKDPM